MNELHPQEIQLELGRIQTGGRGGWVLTATDDEGRLLSVDLSHEDFSRLLGGVVTVSGVVRRNSSERTRGDTRR